MKAKVVCVQPSENKLAVETAVCEVMWKCSEFIQEAKFYTYVCGGEFEGTLLEDPQPSNTSKSDDHPSRQRLR